MFKKGIIGRKVKFISGEMKNGKGVDEDKIGIILDKVLIRENKDVPSSIECYTIVEKGNKKIHIVHPVRIQRIL